ncbi:Baeyer-Villiger monooxygenase [Hypsizygus marmoreus]|uniref:Baeyer-Villiger monooxygenase n=1 Tax=Hypsizygus marmoreus TaxID=39966 RepID=A0A369JZI5_HYPMA|nr:Baeyer-Villiger monooxygenase [Hypsizygus marmoreus]
MRPRVVIVGAGIGGLSFAIALKRQLAFENFTIFEKANSVGGTWRENVYPGCSSDVGIHFYSLSTEPKSDWTCTHPFQPEIQAYWEELAHKHSLEKHIVFGHKVVKAVWDAGAHLYHITVEDTRTGEQITTTAEILISALGILEVPMYPDIPGLSDFRGTIFHSARWIDTELSGKRIAVIGNGASATQFLPIISKLPDIQVTQFCRTANWILPPIRTQYSPWKKWAFKHMPLYMRVTRFVLYLKTEINYFTIFSNSSTRGVMERLFRNYILQNAPAKYHRQIIPNFSLGCKRVIFDTDYLSTLHQDNVEVNWSGIAGMVEDGIVTPQGEKLSFDTVILATGYSADRYPLIVQGTKGQTIQEYHEQKGGPTAYLGTSVPGFPNFYVIGGPNTSTGHTSVIFTEEVQINYILKLIRPILERRLLSIDVSTTATDEYNSKIQARLSASVFVQCVSWYRVGGKGKVNSIFPGTAALFWWWLRWPRWGHYNVVRSDGTEGKYNDSRGKLSIGLAIVGAATVGWMYRFR